MIDSPGRIRLTTRLSRMKSRRHDEMTAVVVVVVVVGRFDFGRIGWNNGDTSNGAENVSKKRKRRILGIFGMEQQSGRIKERNEKEKLNQIAWSLVGQFPGWPCYATPL